MPKTRTTTDPDDEHQDDPRNVAEIERLRAKLARHKREAERLAEVIRQKEREG
jgi:hypothetical protein